MRVSRADREQTVDLLKTAFVQDRLSKDELDARVGQALAARTYADLDALTADIPPGLTQLPERADRPAPAPARPRRPAGKAVKWGGATVAVVIAGASIPVAAADGIVAAAIVAVFFTMLVAIAAGLVTSVIVGAIKLESRQRKRPGGTLPPRPTDAGGAGGTGGASGTGGQASKQRPPIPRRQRPGDPALAL